jgi:hypothetical protein
MDDASAHGLELDWLDPSLASHPDLDFGHALPGACGLGFGVSRTGHVRRIAGAGGYDYGD